MTFEKQKEILEQNNYYGVKESVALAFIESLKNHISNVYLAGQDFIGVAPHLLDIHDDSKWTEFEFIGYANHFEGGGSPNELSTAWLHHIHCNPHHWQHWIYPDGFTPKNSNVENGIVKMPKDYVLEMIADWLGAGKTYTDSWDMTDWLSKNMNRISVHSKTADYLRAILDNLGYADVIYTEKFKHEL